ncbi:MAG TPA: hypothetical protein VGN64_01365, partial [Dyadobacter sp.]|nr:hypothetical protein [Dyadobacter sp.]
MKNLSLQTIGTTTFGLIALLMAGCCTKKLCLGADSMDHISFNNFDSKDLDTVVIYRFVKNSNFLNV